MLRVLGGSRRQGPWQSDPRLQKLALETWNVTSLKRKEPDLVHKIEKFRLDIVGLTSMQGKVSGNCPLKRGWAFFHSGVADNEKQWAGVAILVAPQLSACADSLVLLGDFNAHIGSKSQNWRGMVGKNGPPDLSLKP